MLNTCQLYIIDFYVFIYFTFANYNFNMQKKNAKDENHHLAFLKVCWNPKLIIGYLPFDS